MKATVPARELTDAIITKVSLVKHGANRTPFKIVKAEVPAEQAAPAKLSDRVMQFFKAEPPTAPKVVAVLVSKSADPAVIKVLRDEGYTVQKENAEELETAVLIKQEDFNAETAGTMVALTPEVAVVYDQIVKGFESWTRGKSFTENLQACSFYPCFYLAQDALCETMYQIMYDARSPEDAAPLIDSALSEFKKYVLSLLKVLPVTIFKTEKALLAEFEGRTKSATVVSKSDPKGETVKTKPTLNEAVAGDLDGLLTVSKSEAAAGTEGAATVTTETTEVTTPAADAAAAAGTETPAPAVSPEEAAAVAAAPAAPAPEAAAVVKSDDPVIAAVQKIADSLGSVMSVVADIKKSQDETAARVAALEGGVATAVQKADGAVEIAKNTVVTGVDFSKLDEGLTTMNGGRTDVRKSDAPSGEQGKTSDVWAGVLPGLAGHAKS